MKLLKFKGFALAFAVLIGFWACGSEPKSVSFEKAPTPTPDGKLGFADVEAVFKEKCQSCHVAGAAERKPLLTLADVKLVRYAALSRLKADNENVMPPSSREFKKSDEGKKLIQYLSEGREMNSTPAPSAEPGAALGSYAGIKKTLDDKCSTCHRGATPSGAYDTTTREKAVLKASKAADYMQGKGGTMPISGGRIDETAEGKLLLEWFRAGAPL